MPWEADAPNCGFSTVRPWLPVGSDHVARAVDREEADAGSLLHLTRRLLAFRKAHPALRWGEAKLVEAGRTRLIFRRSVGDERLTCLFNLGAEPAAWPRGMSKAAEPLFSVGGAGRGALPGYSGCILPG